MITQERLKHLIDYNKQTGIFRWKINRRGVAKAGDVAGHITTGKGGKRYIIISVDGSYYYGQQLAFMYVLGGFAKDQVDHKNGDASDNRWDNLRPVTAAENQRNARLRSDNTTGVPGVSLIRGVFAVRISNGCKREFLGRFDNIFDAACSRKSAERKYGFHINHGRKVSY